MVLLGAQQLITTIETVAMASVPVRRFVHRFCIAPYDPVKFVARGAYGLRTLQWLCRLQLWSVELLRMGLVDRDVRSRIADTLYPWMLTELVWRRMRSLRSL
jgi:hypothetical protein